MWSLPDIAALNADAVKNAGRYLRAEQTGRLGRKRVECDHCGKPATVVVPWYDPFSDDPKGVIGTCKEHEDAFGFPGDGFFTCDDCGRVHAENYTWELYVKHTDDGDTLCIPCWQKRILRPFNADEDHWIPLTDAAIDRLDFKRVQQAPHILVVGMDPPKSLRFIGNVEFDSMTGGALRGFSSADSTPDRGLVEIQGLLYKAKAGGAERAILILDAAYQFAVSVGVYVPSGKE